MLQDRFMKDRKRCACVTQTCPAFQCYSSTSSLDFFPSALTTAFSK